jgi:peptidoglycan hydrolase-like protein with peptidoglycan-binding domain
MLSSRVKLQLVAFFLLSGGVAGNLFLMQPQMRGSRAENRQVASAEATGFGDTGSIERTTLDPVHASAPALASLSTAELPSDAADVTRAIQRELEVRGYETGGADGVAGSMTRAAIMGFEYDHGLVLTGRASQELLQSILLGSSGGRAKPVGSRGQSAEAREVIRGVQTSLAMLGYKPGPADGQLTPESQRAIREFEIDQALPESGRVSGPLVARLARLVSEGQIASRR